MPNYSIHSDSMEEENAGYAVFTTDHGYEEAPDPLTAAVQAISEKTDTNPTVAQAQESLDSTGEGAFVAAVVDTDTFETTLVELRPNVSENKWDAVEAAFPQARPDSAFRGDTAESAEDDIIGGLLASLFAEGAGDEDGNVISEDGLGALA